MEFFASAAHGAENVLGEELQELGFKQLRRHGGGVSFIGEKEDGWRACLYSRIAQRIMTPIGRFPAADPEALYAGGVALPWENYLTPHHTLAVAAFCRDGQITHSDFAALKLKDAIVDRLRQVAGERPTVNRDNPDLLGGKSQTTHRHGCRKNHLGTI